MRPFVPLLYLIFCFDIFCRILVLQVHYFYSILSSLLPSSLPTSLTIPPSLPLLPSALLPSPLLSSLSSPFLSSLPLSFHPSLSLSSPSLSSCFQHIRGHPEGPLLHCCEYLPRHLLEPQIHHELPDKRRLRVRGHRKCPDHSRQSDRILYVQAVHFICVSYPFSSQ
jgi:hypothetical protein